MVWYSLENNICRCSEFQIAVRGGMENPPGGEIESEILLGGFFYRVKGT